MDLSLKKPLKTFEMFLEDHKYDEHETWRLLLKPKTSTPLKGTEIDVLPQEMNIEIANVFSEFHFGGHVDLEYISQNIKIVEFTKRENCLKLRIRKPLMATLWPTGAVSLKGAKTADESLFGARFVASIIQDLGYVVRMHDLKIVNVVCSFVLPFALSANNFAAEILKETENEQRSCVVYKMQEPKATFFIHYSGSGYASAASVELLYEALEGFYRMARKYAVPPSCEEKKQIKQK